MHDGPERATKSGSTTGVPLALISAAAFALSGSFASALFRRGWSPGAAVSIRIAISAAVLAVPALVGLKGNWGALRRNARTILLFGLLAVAGAQLFYFNAVQTLSVGVALMLEYMGLVLVVFWQWMRSRRPPSRATAIGVGLALIGLVLVLDVLGGFKVDLAGVAWGLGAAVGLATYYVIAGEGISEVPPITMAGCGMVIGSLTLGLMAAVGVLPIRVGTGNVELASTSMPWWVAVGGLGIITGAMAYSTGVIAAGRLGAKVSAFLGLTEVMFAVIFAWILLDQLPEMIQLFGGLFIIAGIGVVRREQLQGT